MYILIGDSLIQNYEHSNVISYPGMTLEHFITNMDLHKNKDKDIEYIFCFGINDLSSGIAEYEVINNYVKLTEIYKDCCLILPPLQAESFYNKCFDKVDCVFIPSFMYNYQTIDGLHPTTDMLIELKKDIQNNK
jgi:hypothetical protein